MWEYWRDDKGYENALRDYYSKALKSDHRVRDALQGLKNAEATIDFIMDQYEIEED